MDEGEILFLKIFLVAIVLVVVIWILRIRSSIKKQQPIRLEIERQGGHTIEIKENIGDYHRGTYTYEIVFSDQFGTKYHTSCKVNEHGEEKLYWTKSPEELMRNKQLNNNERNLDSSHGRKPDQFKNTESMPKTSKEQIIDDLHAENQQLLQEIEQLQKGTRKDEEQIPR